MAMRAIIRMIRSTTDDMSCATTHFRLRSPWMRAGDWHKITLWKNGRQLPNIRCTDLVHVYIYYKLTSISCHNHRYISNLNEDERFKPHGRTRHDTNQENIFAIRRQCQRAVMLDIVWNLVSCGLLTTILLAKLLRSRINIKKKDISHGQILPDSPHSPMKGKKCNKLHWMIVEILHTNNKDLARKECKDLAKAKTSHWRATMRLRVTDAYEWMLWAFKTSIQNKCILSTLVKTRVYVSWGTWDRIITQSWDWTEYAKWLWAYH